MAFETRALEGSVLEGRYLVGQPSREGETWTEHRALDTRTNTEVDIRVVRAGLGPESRAASALGLEAVVASEVRHPNVLAPRDVGILDDTTPYLVLARHDAETLEDRVCLSGSLAVSDVIRMGLGLCSVLAAAHDRGIVHGDLRPQHVMLVERDGVLLSTLVSGWGSTRDVRAGAFVFSNAAYVAPELLEGAGPSPASDVYALGAILHLAATGFPPYTAPSRTELSRMVKEGALRSPSAFRPELPPRLARAIEQSLSADPSRRFADVRELLAALEAVRASAVVAPSAKPRPAMGDAFNREVTEVERVQRAHRVLELVIDSEALPSSCGPWAKSDVVPSLRSIDAARVIC